MSTRTEPTTGPPSPTIEPPAPRREATLQPPGLGQQFKRFALGRAIPTHRLVHERLGKVIALPIFSSDALSSVAYATEEMMRAMYFAAGVAMFSLVMPISTAVVVILVTLVFSYRQTIKAYPSAGGAYIVTKDNFGLLPAQVAGVALLTDYVLTVAVSISAGVAAIVTAANGLYPYRVVLALFFLLVLVWGNLRGVRESGKMFALPTYLFILSILTLLVVGYYRMTIGGGLPPASTAHLPPAPEGSGLLYGVTLFIVLKALASGTTALTGVEAISNGVPAFRPPEWRNARATLNTLGVILAVMFLGIGYLVSQLHIAPDLTDRDTVLGLLAAHVFGSGSIGHAAFLFMQIATMAVLVLAANTAFADFPRLANFHAGDAFMPRQFTRRGHRLVFSNGIIALGLAAAFLIVIFQANVTRLIPFYALGVFTSFTMSQAGMAKRHLRLREPGWRHGLAINAFGAVATLVVDVVIIVTKFPDDIAILILVPVMVTLLVRMNRQYEREAGELETLTTFERGRLTRPVALVLVEDLDRKTLHALQYARTIRADQVHAVTMEPGDGRSAELERRWAGLEAKIPLRILRHDGDAAASIAGYAAALSATAEVTVIVPRPARMGLIERLRRTRSENKISRALAPYDRIQVTLVSDHEGSEHEEQAEPPRLLAPRPLHDAVILVDRPDRATMRAVRYALAIGADEVRAVHAAVDPDVQEELIARWMELAVPIELDLVECWDRDLVRALERFMVERMRPSGETTVVLPRRDYATLPQRILHDRTNRKIARALGRYRHTDIAVVPYHFARRAPTVVDGTPSAPTTAPAR